MKNRIIVIVFSLMVAAASLMVAGFWQRRMLDEVDKPRIDNASYLVHTWVIAFIVAAVTAVWTAFSIYLEWKRRDWYDDDGYLVE